MIRFLCGWLSLYSAFACANQDKIVDASQNIQGMLYYKKIPDELVNWISSEIQLLDKKDSIQWKDTTGRRRKTFEFGFSFKEMEKNQRIVKHDIPPFLVEARKRIVLLFKDQLKEKDPEKYENCIITFYSEGDGIKPHTDRNYFGPDILGLIVVPDQSEDPHCPASSLCFTKLESLEDPIFLSEEVGTAYLITGELRTDWEHQLSPVVSERISIQFRTIDEEVIAAYVNDSVGGR